MESSWSFLKLYYDNSISCFDDSISCFEKKYWAPGGKWETFCRRSYLVRRPGSAKNNTISCVDDSISCLDIWIELFREYKKHWKKEVFHFKPWKCSAPIWSVFSGLWSGSRLFWRNWSGNGPDLHQKVQIWLKMEERMMKIGLFEHAFNDAMNVM